MRHGSLLFFVLVLVTASVKSQTPTPLQIQLQQVATGLAAPVGIYSAGDQRLFILEQAQGDIEIILTDGTYVGKFLDITGLISTGGERGLLGMAFHPNYANNGYFYINYTNTAGHTVVARYTVSSDPNVANPSSAQILLTINQPFANHNGGHMAFGPDGYLYIGMGDGGSSGDPANRAQNPGILLGKMLRINVDGATPYSIPANNPFVGVAGYAPEIWSTGLRNPWKFSFDRETGDMWIGDVGQGLWEEIDFEPAGSPGGLNWGWRCYEGNASYNLSGCGSSSQYTFPVAVYSHSAPQSFCSVTGGIVYRGSVFSYMQGHYIFCDYCNSDFYSLLPNGSGGFTSSLVLDGPGTNYTAFGEDHLGELYVARANGVIFRITDACGSSMPVISSNGDGALICTGGSTIWWWKDGVLIPGATGPTFTPQDSGEYHATATMSVGCVRPSNSIHWLVNGGIPGCTYSEAINYNPLAEADDGSCDFGAPGCTYPNALNYNPLAVRDDGSCLFGTLGCIYPEAINFDPDATMDDGSCDFGTPGCTYSQALNYQPLAVYDDGSCVFPQSVDCPLDFNADGVVNVPDLLIFIAAWGTICD